MHRPLTQFINILVQIGGWSLLAASFLVTYEVIARKLLGSSLAGADEITGYVFAISTACAYSYALITRSNIRIDFVYNRLPKGAQRILDIVGMALSAGLLGVICYYSYNIVSDAFLYNSRSITPLQTPLAIPQTLWFGALCIALLTACALLIESIIAMVRGDLDQVNRLVGVPSLDEEIKAELGEEPAPSPKDS